MQARESRSIRKHAAVEWTGLNGLDLRRGDHLGSSVSSDSSKSYRTLQSFAISLMPALRARCLCEGMWLLSLCRDGCLTDVLRKRCRSPSSLQSNDDVLDPHH